jgi:pyrroloquinoline quinone (PQQ) biosynthesis protein C
MMGFFKELQAATEESRGHLLNSPLISDALAGAVTRERYAAFLCQAYHHVKHTVPLLMATGGRVSQDREFLRVALAEYIEEEQGHQEWVLNDIEACGYDRELARDAVPNAATEMMVAYAYHVIDRVNPVGFFGMVHVLEGTSVNVADQAAQCIQQSTGLPHSAFSYLRSHGALDVSHVAFFENLMDRIEDREDRRVIIHCAQRFYHLYRAVLDSVEAGQALALAA